MIPRSLFYIIAIILVSGWLFCFFYLKTGSQLIHILLALALVSTIIGLFKKDGE